VGRGVMGYGKVCFLFFYCSFYFFFVVSLLLSAVLGVSEALNLFSSTPQFVFLV